MKKVMRAALAMAIAVSFVSTIWAYEIPEDNTKAKYFYVFGPAGDPNLGAENPQREIYISVPGYETEELYIAIYDPDTGDFRDLRPDPNEPWDTVCEFAVYGEDGNLLDKQEFGESKAYDKNYYLFGPYNKELGTKSDGFYIFKLAVNALEGKDANLFRVKIYPYSAEAFSYDITIRMLEHKDSKMYFYPQVPADAASITVENYDMDVDGGTGELFDLYGRMRYKIKNSVSGEWSSTEVPIVSGQARRLEYVITKKTQRRAHVGLVFKDEKGDALPIYFKDSARVTARPRPRVIAAEAPRQPQKETRPKPLQCNEFTFDATSSYDPDNQNLSYWWDFGDGQTSTEPVVTHTYQKAGDYAVRLTVKDSSGLSCDTSSVTQTVTVNMPPRPDFIFSDKPCVDQVIAFDASSTEDDPQDTLSYRWDFGDGATAEGQKATKAYTKGGTHKVTLIVDDNVGTKCSVATLQKQITVNSPPIADAGSDIEMCVKSGEELVVNFDGSGSSDPDADELAYYWDFGDGENATGQFAEHTYKKGGAYTVKLLVDDGVGSQCSSDSDTITARLNTQPVADAGPNLVCCLGQEAVFDGSGSYDADGDMLSYHWDFGDGTTAEGQKATHAYLKRGAYTVTLKVDDNAGTACSVSTTSFKAVVNESPVAIIKVSE